MTETVASPSLSRGAVAALGVAGALALAWPFVLSTFGRGDVYLWMGPYALLVIAVAFGLSRAAPLPKEHVRRPLRDVVVGLVVGVVMTAGTYAAFAVCVRVVPALGPHVATLYASAQTESLGDALAWTCVVIVAEELLWRGAMLVLLTRRMGRLAAGLLSLGIYTLAQGGSGSLVVMTAALVCGAFWTAERVFTTSLVAPLISHTIWTLTVIHLVPLTH